MLRMTKNMKKLFIKTLWSIVNPVRKMYWYIFRPKTRGVKCIIKHQDKILFVKLSYGHKNWTLPGGGVGKNETWEQAVRREVLEEVGISVGELKEIGEFINNKEYKVDMVKCFLAEVPDEVYKIDNIEISEARWCPLNEIPESHKPRLIEILSYIK
jgi:ADP-ribose pyrophosphatase YjhB (NUDIX family)